MTQETIAGMVDNFGHDLQGAGVAITQLDLDTRTNLPLLQSMGKQIFERWTRLLTGGAPGRDQ